jgi:hypothetical protein
MVQRASIFVAGFKSQGAMPFLVRRFDDVSEEHARSDSSLRAAGIAARGVVTKPRLAQA